MHPEVVQREPGNCPICGMPLEKVPERRMRVESREPKIQLDAAPGKHPDSGRGDAPQEQDHSTHVTQSAAAEMKPTQP
jgi:hypothetical protein